MHLTKQQSNRFNSHNEDETSRLAEALAGNHYWTKKFCIFRKIISTVLEPIKLVN